MNADIKSAWQGWHDALGRLTDHQYDCDEFMVGKTCAGCTLARQREWDAYCRFYAMKHGVAA